jgi:hypothetical protein
MQSVPNGYHHKRSNPAQARWTRYNIIHLLTGYEGYSTFIVPKVPTIFRGNAEDNSWYRGENEVLLPEYQVYKCFIVLNNCAIKNYIL